MKIKTSIYLLLFILFSFNGVAQSLLQDIKYQAELATFLSNSEQTPFGLRANQYGIVPLESQFVTLRGTANKDYDSTHTFLDRLPKFGFGYGISTAVNVGKINKIYLPEAYFKMRLGAFEIYSGRRKEIVGLVDTTLSSGSYIWSGNALPIPKIQISIPNYVSIIGKGLISIKGSYAHGWFGDQEISKEFYLHQKTLYFQIGKPQWRVKFYSGFNHQAQWGGKPIEPYTEPQTGKLITTYGNDLKTYLNVVSGVSLNTKGGADIPGVPINEAWNRSGNHLGTIDVGASISLNTCDILIYRQSIFEDGSLFYLNNITDGIFGISYEKKGTKNDISVSGINIELINTTNQGGSVFLNAPPELRGSDNYFNNELYRWTYNNQTIGTPLIFGIPYLNEELFNSNPNFFKTISESQIINNRVAAISTKINLKILQFNTFTHFIYSHNRGTYYHTFDKKQASILQEVNTLYKKNNIISAKIAFDSNGILNKSFGIMLGIKRLFL